MNNLKTYTPVFIIRSKQDYKELNKVQGEFYVAVETPVSQGSIDKKLLKALFSEDVPFMLLFTNLPESNLSSEDIELLNLCFFSKNYIRLADSPVIAFSQTIVKSGLAKNEFVIEKLVAQFKQQGWQSVITWQLFNTLSFADQLQKKESGALFLNQIDFDEQFLLQHFFNNPENIGCFIFFNSSTIRSATTLENEFFFLCKIALNTPPLLELYLTNYISAKKLGTKASIEYQRLQERLNNAESTIQIIRTKYKDDYDILFNWYQKEYEVLPLWYKRFGHILKVISGQRSFKSLLSDDEKKKAALT
ncbi:MAG: hypothetical protein QM726_11780 [Chitinophagaceae bacterium]